MRVKFFIILFAIFLLGNTSLVFADVLINEVQIGGITIDDEFIELYNNGDSAVDLSEWEITKKTSTGNETTLVSKTRLKDKSIGASGYFLIGREGKYQGSVTTDALWATSYSLSKENSLLLYNGDVLIDQTSWEDIETGKSIQRQTNGTWNIYTPTPGAENNSSSSTSSGTNTDTQTENNSNSSSGAVYSSSTAGLEVLIPKTKILVEDPVLVGVPVGFDALTTGMANNSLFYGKYFWNFGDGSSKEINSYNALPFYHTFYYEGEYSVVLEYYENSYSIKPKAINTVLVDVVPKSILISRVGEEADFFVEISNETEYDADISGWIILSNLKSFVFPSNTTLRSQKKIILSPLITGFTINDKETLRLMDKLGTLVYDFGDISKPVLVPEINKIINTKEQNASSRISAKIGEIPIEDGEPESVALENVNLSANAFDTFDENKEGVDLGFLYLALFLGVSGSAVYFLRSNGRKQDTNEPGKDFEILDE